MSAKKEPVSDGHVRRSISVRLIRHAESQNNQVYRDARRLYKGGTSNFDEQGWCEYVDRNRKADPGLSQKGHAQAQHLSKFMAPHLNNQACPPVQIITSPMRRTLETILPTLQALQLYHDKEEDKDKDQLNPNKKPKTSIIVNAFYHESEGCHIRDKPEQGMTPAEIKRILQTHTKTATATATANTEHNNLNDNIQVEGFPSSDQGWYVNGTGAETRAESEARAAKFFLWLCELLDHQLEESSSDCHAGVFDAGVAVPGEEGECEHDKISVRQRKRRTCLLMGHGDFMGLVLKRIVTGFGHYVENEGVTHRSAFVHFNTGITELEYFGNGRFLIMSSNQTPHFHPNEYSSLRSGGGLKDGWSYIVPNDDEFILDTEVSFSDELESHIREQTQALKELYLASSPTVSNGSPDNEKDWGDVDGDRDGKNILVVSKVDNIKTNETQNDGVGGDDGDDGDDDETNTNQVESKTSTSTSTSATNREISFVVKRGLQVVGCASYNPESGRVKDVVIRPSAKKSQVGKMLLNAVKEHTRKLGRSGSLLFLPETKESKHFLETLGFEEGG